MTMWVGTGGVGELVHDEQARVSALDHGFTVGDGIFETMKLVHGRVFLLSWHLERLHESARVMRIALPTNATLTSVVRRVAAANDCGALGRLRLTITAGVGPLGSSRNAVPPTVTCAATAMAPRLGSATLQYAGWPRNERSPLAGVKSTSYSENVLALAEATAAGASEALFLNTRDEICECTGANIFIVRDGVAFTPPATAGLLRGITRRFVLTLATADLDVREAVLTRSDLESADEVFLTSTFQEVRPVTRIGDHAFAEGPITAELAKRFAIQASSPSCWT